MKRHLVISTALIVIILGAGRAAVGSTCASLANFAFPDTTITAAQSVPAGTYTAPDGEVFTDMPAFCRVAATLTPTSDSNIKVEVWMRYSGRNGRYLGLGNGGIGRPSQAALPLAGCAAHNRRLGRLSEGRKTS